MKFIYLTLNWIFGILFMISGLGLIFLYPLSGLSLILISLLLLPPIRKLVYSKTNKEIPIMARGISIFILIIAFFVFTGLKQNRDARMLAAKEAQEKDKVVATNIDYFNKNSSQILDEINKSFQKGNYEGVISLSSKYLSSKNQELIELNSASKSKLATIEKEAIEKADRESKTEAILAKLEAFPESDYLPNLIFYKQLVILNPDNEKYIERRTFYSRKIKERNEKTRKAEKAIATPKPETTTSISFKEIRHNMEVMTDLQFEEYAKTLIGKRVGWSGYVEDVKQKFLGGYEVWIDMDSPDELFSVQDITFEVSREQALSLKKDSRIKFVGTISFVMNLFTSLQISLDQVKVI